MDLPNELFFEIFDHLEVPELVPIFGVFPDIVEAYADVRNIFKDVIRYNEHLFQMYVFDYYKIDTVMQKVAELGGSWEVFKFMFECGFPYFDRCKRCDQLSPTWFENDPIAGILGEGIYEAIKHHPNIKKCLDEINELSKDNEYFKEFNDEMNKWYESFAPDILSDLHILYEKYEEDENVTFRPNAYFIAWYAMENDDLYTFVEVSKYDDLCLEYGRRCIMHSIIQNNIDFASAAMVFVPVDDLLNNEENDDDMK